VIFCCFEHRSLLNLLLFFFWESSFWCLDVCDFQLMIWKWLIYHLETNERGYDMKISERKISLSDCKKCKLINLILNTKKLNILFYHWERTITKYFAVHHVQSNLCITITLGTQNFWLFLTGCGSSEQALCYKNWKWDIKILVVVNKWSLFRVYYSGLIVAHLHIWLERQ